MRQLTEIEKTKILSTLSKLTEGKIVSGISVYGSQVAGYARDDSDYDAIVVLSPFRQKIRYYYLNGEVECSALVVDTKSFENDCRRSALGEFVSGRFLNPYEAINGREFLETNECAFKRKVMLEGLFEAVAEYQDLAFEIEFGLPYFLFEKLRKRAAIYPPVVYSYSQTYGDKLGAANLASSLTGFRRAAEALEKERVLRLVSDDRVRLGFQTTRTSNSSAEFKGGIGARVSAAASYTTKSIRQYAVHGYAGRVRPLVVGKEVASKLTRLRTPKSSKLPDAIHHPKSFWSIPEGKLFVRSEDWISDLTALFGMRETNCKVNEKPIGEIYTASNYFVVDDGSNHREFVVKRFKDFKAMKWGILNVWSLKNADFVTNSTVRLSREYHGLNEFRKMGIHTPRVIAVFLPQEMLVTSFIKGSDLSSLQSTYLDGESDDLSPFRRFGEILATLHNNDYCMGDTKPSNAVLSDEDSEIYLVDLEQSHPRGNPVWDVAEFVYYSIRFTMKEEKARKLLDAFFDGYTGMKENKDALRIVERTVDFRYRAPFQAFIAPNVLGAIVQDIKQRKK